MLSRSSERLEKLAPVLTGGSLLMPVPELPNLEASVLRAIQARETHLSRLHALLLSGCGPVPENRAQYAAYAPLLASVRNETSVDLEQLRLTSVEVVEAIVRWRRRRQRPFEPFVWRSHNYLLKMLLDVFFLGLALTVADATADPFLLRVFSDALVRDRQADAEAAIEQQKQQSAAALIQGSYRAKHGSPQPQVSGLVVEVGGGAGSSPPASPTSALPAARAAYARRKRLCATFSPQRRHTKQELVRMWAAERVLEAEQAHLGAAFEPIAPVLQPADFEVRRMAALIWFGQGEPPELIALDARLPNSPPKSRTRDPDPARKPDRSRASLASRSKLETPSSPSRSSPNLR